MAYPAVPWCKPHLICPQMYIQFSWANIRQLLHPFEIAIRPTGGNKIFVNNTEGVPAKRWVCEAHSQFAGSKLVALGGHFSIQQKCPVHYEHHDGTWTIQHNESVSPVSQLSNA